MKLFVFCAIIISLSACSTANYISQDIQTPCFTKKNTLRANLNVPFQGIQPVVSYSITSALGVCGSFVLSANAGAEVGMIYYKQMFKKAFERKKRKLFFDINGGLGAGSCDNNNREYMEWHGPTQECKSAWYKGYLQGDIYFAKDKEDSKKSTQFGIGSKLNLCYYDYLQKNDLTYDDRYSDGPVYIDVERSAKQFIMPVQDFYLFLSKDLAMGNVALNLAFKFGYSVPYFNVKYTDRQIKEYLSYNNPYSKDIYSEKSDQLVYNKLIFNISVGIKI